MELNVGTSPYVTELQAHRQNALSARKHLLLCTVYSQTQPKQSAAADQRRLSLSFVDIVFLVKSFTTMST